MSDLLPSLNSGRACAKASASGGSPFGRFSALPPKVLLPPPSSLGGWRGLCPRVDGTGRSSPSRALSPLPPSPSQATIREILTRYLPEACLSFSCCPAVTPPGSPLQPCRVSASVFTPPACPVCTQLTHVRTCTRTLHTLTHPLPYTLPCPSPPHQGGLAVAPGTGPVASFSPVSSRRQGWARQGWPLLSRSATSSSHHLRDLGQ